MHHCKWCSDISLAHLQTKHRDKEQQCHCSQIKCVLSMDVSRKTRPEYYLENTVKQENSEKLTILWVDTIPDSHSIGFFMNLPFLTFINSELLSVHFPWPLRLPYHLTLSWCKAIFTEIQIFKKPSRLPQLLGKHSKEIFFFSFLYFL